MDKHQTKPNTIANSLHRTTLEQPQLEDLQASFNRELKMLGSLLTRSSADKLLDTRGFNISAYVTERIRVSEELMVLLEHIEAYLDD